MSIKRTAIRIDIAISDDSNKSFELRNIALNDATQEFATILRIITAAEFLQSVRFDLPKEWYEHLAFVTSLTVHNDDSNLVFTLGHGDTFYQYVVPADDFLEYFDIDERFNTFSGFGESIDIEGMEGIFAFWSNSSEVILVTDKKTFVLLVDRYENDQLDTVWFVDKKEVYSDCALLPTDYLAELKSSLPEPIFKAMVGNVFYEATK